MRWLLIGMLLFFSPLTRAGECGKLDGTLRGFNVSTNLEESDFEDIKRTRANAVRVAFAKQPLFLNDGSLNPEAMATLARYVGYARKNGIGILVDMHTFPGSKKLFSGSPEDAIWKDSALRAALVASYGKLAAHYAHEPYVYGYDLLNEPAPPTDNYALYYRFTHELISAIRSASPGKAIVIQSPITLGKNNIPDSQYKTWSYLKKFQGDDIVYSIHYYDPGHYTHQGIGHFKSGQSLPFLLSMPIALRQYVSGMLSEVGKAGRPVIIGEFSASTRAGDDSLLYLDALASVFEENHWSWFYHAFREAEIWDPELIKGRVGAQARSLDAPRMQLLKKYFSRNTSFDCLASWNPAPGEN